MSQSSELLLSMDGLRISDIWSTPKFNSKVASLQLLETGNLVLVDDQNVRLWESFADPTDTIVSGQRLGVGKALVSTRSADDLASGDYRLTVTNGDAVMQWKRVTYWKMSNDVKAFKDSNSAVSSMEVNGTGLFLSAGNGSTAVFSVKLGASDSKDFRIAKIGSDGRLRISSFIGQNFVEEFSAPSQHCQLPLVCGRLGLCSGTAGSVQGNCACPPGFYSKLHPAGSECVPSDESLSLPPPCKTNGLPTNHENSPVSFLKLGIGMDYVANSFMDPLKRGANLSVCQDLCLQNCSCLAIFHEASSGSCYLIENELGSIITNSATQSDRLGYIKTLVVSSASNDKKHGFPVAGLVLLISSGVVLIVAVTLIASLWLRRKRNFGPTKIPKLDRWNSSSSTESEEISIPGLPVRFDYEELAAATDNFKNQIGSGGFGTVYKGTLPDKTVVAVKKITNLGVQGKREFFTEVSIIANIHHVNLVRLKGFCVQGSKRFLVFEFMNRGSLDRLLFGTSGPVLEWKERFEIAIGTARGLAYLHNGCDHKIIHCDVKPENILLHDNSQVKISDFGLSKLLSPEQSGFFTTMRGTRGYLAPEWLTSSAISDKADVYSYGMVLLEIVRGKKNYSLQMWNYKAKNDNDSGRSSSSTSCSSVERQAAYFPLLALEMHEQRKYLELADPRLEGRVSSEEVEKLIKIALCCVQEDPVLRPSMANVVGMLEGALPLAEPRVQSLNFLRFYGQRFTETSSQVEGCNQKNEFVLWTSSGTSGSYNSLSYVSSEQVSGPR